MNGLTREQFHYLAGQGRSVPVYRQLEADLETPVSVYLKLRDKGQTPSFLLESVEKAEQVGRYSFLGVNPQRWIIARGEKVHLVDNGQTHFFRLEKGQDPLHIVAQEVARYQPVAALDQVMPDMPRFFGGAVGYLAYDMIRFWERLPENSVDPLGLPDMHMLIADTLVVFDHVKHRLLLFANALVPPDGDLDAIYDEAIARLDALEQRVRAPLPTPTEQVNCPGTELVSNVTQAEYEARVRKAKEYIAAGDIFQVVPSQRLSCVTQAEPFAIYRALRQLNPSPYMFFFDLGGDPHLHLIGSSPEVLTRLQGRVAEVRPIAGTRPRGKNETEDQALAAELLADPKERAEHVMLVDLGRNDLGRVCEYGTVRVDDLLTVERYSHVIHLVSRVTGILRSDMDVYDLIRATFPAGTVSGAPKVRAMEIIEELEGVRRCCYAGAVGYFGFNGNMDTCITIRTIVMLGQTAYLQAGGGVVADSEPTREWEETLHKARALGVAIRRAEGAKSGQ